MFFENALPGRISGSLDYYPFGMMIGRAYNPSLYRFGFNKGSEKDDEIAGGGNHFTTKDREGDPRLATWWGVDPKAADQAWQSPYSYMDGNPILNNDPTGDGIWEIYQGILKGIGEDSWALSMFSVQVTNHPINTGKAVAHSVAHTGSTIKAAENQVKSDWVSGDFGKGKAIWAVGSMLIPGEGEVSAGEKTIIEGEKVVVETEKAVVTVEKAEVVSQKVKVAPKAIGPIGDPGGLVTTQIPPEWDMKTTKKGDGTIFKDPKNPVANNVRVMSAKKNSPNPSQQKPYVKQTKGGTVVDVNGKATKHDSLAAHIPIEDFKMN